MTVAAPPLHRLVLANVLALVAVFVLLAVTPAPVRFPADHWEAALLLEGGLLLLAANLLVARPRPRPRRTRVDDGTPELVRLRGLEHFDVAAAAGVIGVVDVVVGDRSGCATALLVSDGWFGSRRFVVGLDEIDRVDRAGRTIVLRD